MKINQIITNIYTTSPKMDFKQFKKDTENKDLFHSAVNLYKERKDEEAFNVFKELAHKGDLSAQNNLGFMYHKGQCGPQSLEEAIKWYKQAAYENHVIAQFNLGAIYYLKYASHFIEALPWFEKAARKGDSDAQNNLGVMHMLGHGTPVNSIAAISWYKKSANQNHAIAQYNLGAIYLLGERDMPVDYVQSYKWSSLSLEQGNVKTQPIINELKSKITPEQISKAERLIIEFKKNKKNSVFIEAYKIITQSTLEKLTEETEYSIANKNFKKALKNYTEGEYDACLTCLGTTVESVFREITGNDNRNNNIHKLIQDFIKANKKLTSHQSVLTALPNFLESVNAIRNQSSTAHPKKEDPTHNLTVFAIHMTASILIFLMNSSEEGKV